MTGKRLARACEKQGFRVRRTRSGFLVYGKDGCSTAGFHLTPASSNRGLQNTVSALRRLGVRV